MDADYRKVTMYLQSFDQHLKLRLELSIFF